MDSTNIITLPMYATADASRLTGLAPARIRRWMQGYEYSVCPGSREIGHRKRLEPILGHTGPEVPSYASFANLIELLLVKRFLNEGITLQKIRKAMLEAKSILKIAHFANKKFFTSGKRIYLDHNDGQTNCMVELLSGGQLAIPEIIRQLGHEIEFNKSTGLAERWFPQEPKGLIVVDPMICFGQPSLLHRGIRTSAVYDAYLGEGESMNMVRELYGLGRKEILAAIQYEKDQIAA